MFNNNSGYSLADIATATGNNGFGGEGGAWWIIILFLFCFMGGAGNGLWGNNYNKQAATTEDVQNQFNFAALERQNNETVAAVKQAAYDVTGAVKDNAFMNNSAIRDVEGIVQRNAYEIQSGVAAVNSNIDSVKYANAMNTKELLASNAEQTQKILDVLAGNRMADMQSQINALQLQAAMCGVVRYPNATVFTAGPAPFYGPGYVPGPGPIPGPAPF